jgi:putative ABC transport system permease protein
MPPPPNAEVGYTAVIRLTLELVLSAFAVGVIATVGAAIFPARRAARVPVADALQDRV